MLHLGKLQTAPQILYTSSRADASFVEHMRQPFEAFIDRADSEEFTLVTPEVRLEKAATFSYEQAIITLFGSQTSQAQIMLLTTDVQFE